jgi:(E)-4-hydroxy-3-methylbut-2-enyl-diphosphate synthase
MSTTRAVKVQSLIIGGDWPISVQTMWKDPLPAPGSQGFEAALARIESLAALGCDLVRFAVPDESAAEALGALARRSVLPLVADIHFDWRLALRCLDFPIAKIRINPGNIGAAWKVAEVAAKALSAGVPIRVGVNAGSLPAELRDAADRVGAIVEAAEREVASLDRLGFRDLIVSMKASDVDTTVPSTLASPKQALSSPASRGTPQPSCPSSARALDRRSASRSRIQWRAKSWRGERSWPALERRGRESP